MELQVKQEQAKVDIYLKRHPVKKKKIKTPVITKTVEIPPVKDKTVNDLNDKNRAFLLLKENGESTKSIADTLGYHPTYAKELNVSLAKYSLKNKKMVVSASKAVKNILKGEPWGTIDKIKDNTALAAAQMVFDRVEPAVQVTQSLNVNIDVVDMLKYRGKVGESDENEPEKS